MGKLNWRNWYRVNKKPVGLGRAVELAEKKPKQRKIKKLSEKRHGFFQYNVYQQRKSPIKRKRR